MKADLLRTGLAVTAVLCAALFFASQPEREFSRRSPAALEKIANAKVLQTLRGQIRSRMGDETDPGRRVDQERAVESQVQAIMKSAPDRIRDTAARMSESMSLAWLGRSRQYLMGADEYYYYYLTSKVDETGGLGGPVREGKYFDELRLAPKGDWSWFNLHPYLGAFWLKAARFFKSKSDSMDILCRFSYLLIAGIVFSFFALGRAMGMGLFPASLGCLSLTLAPMFLQRGSFGTYDTDMYNVLVPMWILIPLFLAQRHPRAAAPLALAGGALTGLYALLWNGWPYILILVTGALFVFAATGIFLKHGRMLRSVLYGLVFAAASLGVAALCVSPREVYMSFRNFITVLPSYAGSPFDVAWPDPFLGVGEAAQASVQKMLFLGFGSNVMVGLAGSGLAWSLWAGTVRRDGMRLLAAILLAAFLAPMMKMAVSTERFAVLLLLPAALAVTLGADAVLRAGEAALGKVPPIRKIPPAVLRAGVMILVIGAVLPQPLLIAHIVGAKARPILNDVWYDALSQIRQKTPADAVVNSWWPPGYFIMSVARRGATCDGGSQQRPATYWMGRMLLSDNEYEAAGILRMLNTSNNDALEYLESLKIGTLPALNILNNILPVGRGDAADVILRGMPADKKDKLLGATHGAPRPGYVLVYDDLITNTLGVSLMAKWDFRKARERRSAEPNISAGASHADYVREQIDLSGGVLKYQQESPLKKQDGDILVFENGLRVDTASMTAVMLGPDGQERGMPMSFFYMEEGSLREKRNFGKLIDASALLILGPGGATSLLAHRDLIRSVMYRMYYLRGEGLKFFKPFVRSEGPSGEVRPTRVAVFEFDDSAFEKSLLEPKLKNKEGL